MKEVTNTVLTAVEAAFELQGSAGKEKPVFKYHPDSGLFMVRGTIDDLGVVKQVLTGLENPGRAAVVLEQGAEIRDALKKLQEEIAQLKAEVAELKKSAGKAGKTNEP